MKTHKIISLLRNPYGLSLEEMKEIRLAAANEIESWEDAFNNLKKYVESLGIDITSYNAMEKVK